MMTKYLKEEELFNHMIKHSGVDPKIGYKNKTMEISKNLNIELLEVNKKYYIYRILI